MNPKTNFVRKVSVDQGRSAKVINNVERVIKGSNDVRATPGWERIWVQILPEAIYILGPKEVANTFEIKETLVSRRGAGYVAASGSDVNNYGEKKTVGHTDGGTDDGEGVSSRVQCADVKKALGAAPQDEPGRQCGGLGP